MSKITSYASKMLALLETRNLEDSGDQPILAMWWIPAGHLPSVAEAVERLEHLRRHGSNPYAFPFNKPFSARDAVEFELPTPVLI